MAKKRTNNLILTALVGLVLAFALGAWVLMSDSGDKTPDRAPVKPTAEALR